MAAQISFLSWSTKPGVRNNGNFCIFNLKVLASNWLCIPVVAVFLPVFGIWKSPFWCQRSWDNFGSQIKQWSEYKGTKIFTTVVKTWLVLIFLLAWASTLFKCYFYLYWHIYCFSNTFLATRGLSCNFQLFKHLNHLPTLVTCLKRGKKRLKMGSQYKPSTQL